MLFGEGRGKRRFTRAAQPVHHADRTAFERFPDRRQRILAAEKMQRNSDGDVR